MCAPLAAATVRFCLLGHAAAVYTVVCNLCIATRYTVARLRASHKKHSCGKQHHLTRRVRQLYVIFLASDHVRLAPGAQAALALPAWAEGLIRCRPHRGRLHLHHRPLKRRGRPRRRRRPPGRR
jgi:hypothetical protein